MAMNTRRPGNPMEAAEAMFKPAKKAVPEVPKRSSAIPVGKESVTMRIDRDVLEAFPGRRPGLAGPCQRRPARSVRAWLGG